MAFFLLLLISATWLLGLMAVNSNVMIFHYLFAVCSCLQVIEQMERCQQMISHQLLPRCLNSKCFPFDFAGHLHLLLPCDLQQRREEEPQERLHREENGIGRVQHHKSLLAYSECTFCWNVWKSGNGAEKSDFSCFLPLLLHPQRTLNSNNAYEDGTIYRSGIGESTVSLDSTLRSAKSRNSYLAYALRYTTLTKWLLLMLC